MKSDTILDYVVFQLSPKHSRCELFVSSNGQTEKLASGLIKPFASHLKVIEDRAAHAVQSSIRLGVEKSEHTETWFTKGTLERFVRFVSTPEALEMVNTFDAEMSQLEAARKIYSQGNGDISGASDDRGATSATDGTKKELLRAIDLRLEAVMKDLTMAFAHASAAGFNPHTVSELQQFADRYGAHSLDEACTKFISVCQRMPDLSNPWKPSLDDQAIQSSWGSDVSTDDFTEDLAGPHNRHQLSNLEQSNMTQTEHQIGQSKFATCQQSNSTAHFPTQQLHSKNEKNEKAIKDEGSIDSSTVQASQHTRRLSVQDRINLFENKQKENTNSGGKPVHVGKSAELRRLSSDVSSAPGFAEKSVLRRWSCVSDMSIDLGCDKDSSMDSPLCTASLSSVSQAGSNLVSRQSDEKDQKDFTDSVSSVKTMPMTGSGDVGDHGVSEKKLRGLLMDRERNAGLKSHLSSEVGNVNIDGKSNNRTGSAESTNQHMTQSFVRVPHSHSRSLSGQIEVGIGIKTKDFQYIGNEGDQLAPQPQYQSFTAGIDEVGKKEFISSDKQSPLTDFHRMKFQKPASAVAEQIQRSHGRRDDVDSENQENIAVVPTPSVDQLQSTRQSEGNQGLNDELKMKANELEKLFTEHKLRFLGDQSGSRCGKLSETQIEQTASGASPANFPGKGTLIYSSGSSSDMAKFDASLTGKMAANHDYGDILRRTFSDLSFSDDSRGNFYEKYMQKRDAKLREEWSLKRAEKEAKLKSLHDAVEQSSVEMKAKFSGSSERWDSFPSARQHAEKFRSFNSRSSMKKYQHPINSFQSEEDEDLSEYSDHKYHGKDGASRSSQGRKLQPNRNMSSTIPRTTTLSGQRSSAKVSSAIAGRRRGQSDKHLAQSVPNFSALKKENTKPSYGIGKATTRSQVKNTARSKSSNGEVIPPVKQEKSRRLKKSSSGNIEFTELSTLNSDDVLIPLKLDREKSERKGNDVDTGTGSDIPQLRVSDGSETLKHEDYDELEVEADGFEDMAKEEEQEELEIMPVEEADDTNDGKPGLSKESDKLGSSRSENGDSLKSISYVDLDSISELPAPVPSTFHTGASLLDSPGESPMSWTSRLHQPFAYSHETSDVDASVDSPVGSPASWNSRMRKKWGSAQNPVVVTNSSLFQSRKDVTKGFKRLLKFGRKTRAAESLMDWISVTTSEGDDDSEDRRDIANRSSEDLRKSRMGFSQGHPSDDGFNESELFNEQVQASNSSIPAPPANFQLKDDQNSGSSIKAPRSFFSLSTFRSKGSESKPR